MSRNRDHVPQVYVGTVPAELYPAGPDAWREALTARGRTVPPNADLRAVPCRASDRFAVYHDVPRVPPPPAPAPAVSKSRSSVLALPQPNLSLVAAGIQPDRTDWVEVTGRLEVTAGCVLFGERWRGWPDSTPSGLVIEFGSMAEVELYDVGTTGCGGDELPFEQASRPEGWIAELYAEWNWDPAYGYVSGHDDTQVMVPPAMVAEAHEHDDDVADYYARRDAEDEEDWAST